MKNIIALKREDLIYYENLTLVKDNVYNHYKDHCLIEAFEDMEDFEGDLEDLQIDDEEEALSYLKSQFGSVKEVVEEVSKNIGISKNRITVRLHNNFYLVYITGCRKDCR